MIRYSGQPLPQNPRIAVIANDAIGNFVIGTPLMQMLRDAHAPRELVYFGGKRSQELSTASDLIDSAFPLHGTNPRSAFAEITEMTSNGGEFDLVVNIEWSRFAVTSASVLAGERTLVCGPSLDSEGRNLLPWPEDVQGKLWADQEWVDPNVCTRYPFLRTPFIGEIFCRLAYLEGAVPNYKVPTVVPTGKIPDVLIATSASLVEKLWPVEKWQASLQALMADGLSVGLIGAMPNPRRSYWEGDATEQLLVDSGLCEDFRGMWTLPEVAGALTQARAVLSLDNGIMHLAVASQTPTVALFREGIHRLWTPPSPTLTPVVANPGEPVADIAIESVRSAMRKALSS